jgi:hypothetical protein
MKMLLRIAAVLSFGLCFAGGFWIFCLAAIRVGTSSDAAPIAALGLVLMGMAVFAGAMIWLFAEKCCSLQNNK